MIQKMCLHQVFRPKEKLISIDGCGDCTICTPNKKNIECCRYTPINITIYDVRKDINNSTKFWLIP